MANGEGREHQEDLTTPCECSSHGVRSLLESGFLHFASTMPEFGYPRQPVLNCRRICPAALSLDRNSGCAGRKGVLWLVMRLMFCVISFTDAQGWFTFPA